MNQQRIFWILAAVIISALVFYGIEIAGLMPLSILEATFLAMTPLVLAAVGECINQKAGVINIGLEGILLLTSVLGVYGAELFGNGWGGLFFGMIVGALIGLFLGLISVYARAAQVIAGIGINVFAIGFVPFLLRSIWGFPGIHLFPRALMVQPLYTPIGRINPVTIIAIALAILGHLFLHRTVLGFRIKACGERPEAADVAGIRIDLIRLFTATLGGALCGLGGAFMPLGWFGGVVKEISAGRGFIALACVVFSGLEPLLALAAAFIFGFAEGFAYAVAITPGVKEIIPFYFVHMIPYITTLLVVTIAIGQRRFPAASGLPYRRE
ncbi:MAG: ABC transporter permease [Anaerolineae bacterium]|nr:ABC transporter permease [Anaerolineae bacterium]MDW8103045.1 ABC transporter permease [Anaerolineae bacterium]